MVNNSLINLLLLKTHQQINEFLQ